MADTDAQAFAAYQAITHGKWDKHLRTLMQAIRFRLIKIEETDAPRSTEPNKPN